MTIKQIANVASYVVDMNTIFHLYEKNVAIVHKFDFKGYVAENRAFNDAFRDIDNARMHATFTNARYASVSPDAMAWILAAVKSDPNVFRSQSLERKYTIMGLTDNVTFDNDLAEFVLDPRD